MEVLMLRDSKTHQNWSLEKNNLLPQLDYVLRSNEFAFLLKKTLLNDTLWFCIKLQRVKPHSRRV